MTVFNVNITAMLAFINTFLKGMKQRNFGHIINISSRIAEYYRAGIYYVYQ